MEKTFKKIIVEISRIILGLVFIFSGFVKAIDPWGGAYKIQDYFIAFDLSDLGIIALQLSFLQAAVEFGVGVCLLIGVYRRSSSILVLIIMLFMTPLTLYLAIANPVTDCGCFGDALIISNWHTFYKNIILLIAAFIVCIWSEFMVPLFSRKRYFRVSLWVYVFIIGLSFYCFRYLPVIDFRPYKIGVNIPQQMEIPPDAEQPEYDIKLLYAQGVSVQEFTIDNYPKDDSTWVFVDTKMRLIKKGYEPPIHGFSITNSDGIEITDEILSNPSYTFLLIAHELEDSKDSNVDKINGIYDFSKDSGYDFYALTSSISESIQDWIENTGAEYPFCSADDITLKTIIRSNPGLMLIKNGTIINKWPNTKLPDTEKLNKLIEQTNIGNAPITHNFLTVLLLALLFSIPLILLFVYDVSNRRKKHIRSRNNNH